MGKVGELVVPRTSRLNNCIYSICELILINQIVNEEPINTVFAQHNKLPHMLLHCQHIPYCCYWLLSVTTLINLPSCLGLWDKFVPLHTPTRRQAFAADRRFRNTGSPSPSSWKRSCRHAQTLFAKWRGAIPAWNEILIFSHCDITDRTHLQVYYTYSSHCVHQSEGQTTGAVNVIPSALFAVLGWSPTPLSDEDAQDWILEGLQIVTKVSEEYITQQIMLHSHATQGNKQTENKRWIRRAFPYILPSIAKYILLLCHPVTF